mmetsp:Transcript_4923/g.14733  ORF Transcript_4923/g.14733 Transcript_4923/m.14733 type:complete len:341 (-) Transcript_4923:1227-2249(-)
MLRLLKLRRMSSMLVLVQLLGDFLDKLVPVVLEVPVVSLELAIVDDPDFAPLLVLAHPGQQSGVVRDDDHAALVHLDGVGQGIHTLHVQVVRGLVQKKDVRAGEGDGREDDTRLLTSRQLHDGLHVVVPAEAKPAQLRSHVLHPEAAVWELLQQIVYRCDVQGENVHEVLGIPPNSQLLTAPRIPRRGLDIPGQEVHQGGLSRTIGAHDGYPRAHVDTQVEVLHPKVVPPRVLEVRVHERDQRRVQLRWLRELELDRVVVPLSWRVIHVDVVVVALVLLSLLLLLVQLLLILLHLVLLRPRPARFRRLHLLLILVERLVRFLPPLLVHFLEGGIVALVLV